MRKAQLGTVEAFRAGKPHQGPACRTPRANRDGLYGFGGRIFSTDGRVVFSYAMPVAVRAPNGAVAIIERSAAPSVTTKRHVDALSQAFPTAMVVPAGTLAAYIEAL